MIQNTFNEEFIKKETLCKEFVEKKNLTEEVNINGLVVKLDVVKK